MTDERLLIVREGPLRDLIFLAREAADALRDRNHDDPLARSIDGATAQVAIDISEPARLRDVAPARTLTA